eukprot:UN00748
MSEETKQQDKVFDLATYRKHVISTTTYDAADKDAIVEDQNLVLSDFLAKVQPFEKKIWPNSLRWDIPANAFKSLADNIAHQHKVVFDKIASVKDGEHNFENTLFQYEKLDRDITAAYASLDFPSDVFADKTIRDASNEAKEELSNYLITQTTRKDVYESLKKFAAQTDVVAKLDGEYKKMMEDTMRDFKRLGMDLNDEDRAKLVAIKQKLSSLSIKFSSNLGEEASTYHFTKEQLAGLTEDMLKQYKVDPDTGKYIVTLKVPAYQPVMKHCLVPETRATLEKAYNSRCIEENTPIIEEMLKLRLQQAKLLGFETYADYQN